MDNSFYYDFIAWLMTVTSGFILLSIMTWRGGDVRSHFWGRVQSLLTGARNIPELRKRISSASDLRSTMATLPYGAQLEMAEHLINEGPPYAAIALDAVYDIARSSSEDGRGKALGFLNSRSIPCVARVSLAQRLLASKTDDFAKVVALEALCEIVADDNVYRSGLIDSIVFIAAEGITDQSPRVREVAVASLEVALRNDMSAIDESLARRLCRSEGESRAELLRFIERNQSLVPSASLTASMYGATAIRR